MSKNQESVKERMARLQREKAEAAAKTGAGDSSDLISQLTHEGTGEPNFEELARALEERKEQEATGANDGYVKMTIYVREDIARSFNALCTERGDQKKHTNQALADFIQKKARELGLDK